MLKNCLESCYFVGCPQYDFFQGYELNPRLGKMFDFKLFLMHVGLIGWASVDLCLLYQSYEEIKHLNYPIFFTVSCHFIFILLNLWHADMFLTTATVNYEGVGYLRVLSTCTLVPFLYSLPVIYWFDTDKKYLSTASYYCVQKLGTSICREGSLKFTFLNVLFFRYLVGFGHFIPFIPALLVVAILVMRAAREEWKCKQRYGPAWDRYTSQVRYRLIPYIF
ncbi:lamin-B receptor-like [Limulus polyphemus]|uniref:Lamin-B receptor-like n=1 Tax=Limulus polyphemus TaxID=6850 RepID=A0ABM1TSU1_LIMPO|nr:lamin-B receptor-like [Limulus polyphemus]